jgi:hypothetical protein
MKSLIARYSPDERRALKSRCEELIKFVKRRDLDSAYIDRYKR